MRRNYILAEAVVVCLLCGLGLQAQQSDSSASNNTNLSASLQPAAGTVPRLIKFTGKINPQIAQIAQMKESEGGKNQSPTVLGATFSLYELPEGGSPLWTESQKVQVDEQGGYTVLLGATQPEGLPLDLFTSSKALWLGVQPQLPGQPEQPRVLLVAVPYALKSSDADTLGGLPASAFMLSANPKIVEGVTLPGPISPPAPPTSATITGGGTANYAAMFTGPSTIGNSPIFIGTGGNVGIGTSTPGFGIEVAGPDIFGDSIGLTNTHTGMTFAIALHGKDFNVVKIPGSTFTPFTIQSTTFQDELVLGTAGVGIGTATPQYTLDVNGTGNFTGLVTFAGGQTFPGTGTVTSVGSGAGLTGGPITTSGTLSVATGGVTNTMLANPSLTVTAGSGLTGGGSVSLGGTTTLSLNPNVSGTAGIFSGSATPVVSGTNTANGSYGQLGTSVSGSATGVYGSGGGFGVYGTGVTYGVYGTGGNFGVYGTGGNFGVYGIGGSGTGYGVYGSNTATSGSAYGVYGTSASSSGTGVYGAGSNRGVYGIGGSTGVWGSGSSSGSTGVVGSSSSGTGVEGYTGYSAGGIGVFGYLYNGSGSGAYAVWGYNSGTAGYAGYFSGDLKVTGAITAGTKDFLIDHPLNPADKYLYHASVESSEMKNIYDGIVRLDASGEVVVGLPEWFEALNADFRYQLTAIGAPAPGLYIAEEIADHHFKIAGGPPGTKVSWQVTGVRQDAYAKAHPLQVEVDKPDSERGYYIHPELYGAPEEKGIEWARHPEMMKRMKERRATPPEPPGGGVR